MTDLSDFLQNLFSDEYLFDSAHAAWRAMTQRNEGWILISHFLTFPDVMQLCESVDEVLEAARQLGETLEVNQEGTAIRRKDPLLEKDNPVHRTLFVKPIHPDTTDKEIKNFFSVYGVVEKVEKKIFTEYDRNTGQSSQRIRPTMLIQFSTVEEAKKCVNAKPSFGKLNNIGDHFVPRLHVDFFSDYDEKKSELAEARFLKHKREVLIHGGEATNAKSSTPRPFKFVQTGSILKVLKGPPGVSWREIKSVLSEIGGDQCRVSYVREDGESGITYLYMKTSKAAETLVDLHRSITGTERERVCRIVPVLDICTGEEEQVASEAYLAEENAKARKKHHRNEKRVHGKTNRVADSGPATVLNLPKV